MVRVGKIVRHEDVHGVSGTGDHLADVFEASDGTCVVRWLGKDGSTNVYGSFKNVTNVHGHGGKTEVEWLWEQEQDADPMEAVFDKKVAEAGGVSPVEPTPTGEAAETTAALAGEIIEKAQQLADKVASTDAEE